jgi:hypothetical protein
MKNEITLQTRREFLRRTVLGSALSWTVPAFLADTFSALQSAGRRFRHANRHRQGRDDSRRAANGRRQRRHQHRRALRQ